MIECSGGERRLSIDQGRKPRLRLRQFEAEETSSVVLKPGYGNLWLLPGSPGWFSLFLLLVAENPRCGRESASFVLLSLQLVPTVSAHLRNLK